MRKIVLPVLLFSLIVSCIKLKDSVVDEEKFLGSETNNTSIYNKTGDGTFLNPFNINTDNWGLGRIEKLMLVEFEPLQGYRSIELQVIKSNGKTGGLVILYYAEKEQADVYHTSNLNLSVDMYANVLNNAVITATPIDYGFREEQGLLKANLNFRDRLDNQIEMHVNEKTGEMTPCGLLAPIGGEANNPEFMTIVFMKHFKFLSQKEEEIQVEINGNRAELLKLPVKANGVKGYQTKYSMEPVTVSWNINTDEILHKLKVADDNVFRDQDVEIKCLNNDGHLEIERFTGVQDSHAVNFGFSPAIPDLQCLAENAKVKGRFSMSVDDIEGIIAGNYSISNQTGEIEILLAPTKGYSPVPGKAWMKKLEWKAYITTEPEYKIKSQWIKN